MQSRNSITTTDAPHQKQGDPTQPASGLAGTAQTESFNTALTVDAAGGLQRAAKTS
jgi:hypothetical protein